MRPQRTQAHAQMRRCAQWGSRVRHGGDDPGQTADHMTQVLQLLTEMLEAQGYLIYRQRREAGGCCSRAHKERFQSPIGRRRDGLRA